MPRLMMIGGPNGSGKSTLTAAILERGFDFGDYINADDIAMAAGGRYEDRVTAAAREAEKRCEAALQAGRDFALETVMSHPSKLELMQRARRLGFQVILHFVSTADPQLNVARVANRVRRGGHDVAPDTIIRRYQRTMDALPTALRIADRVNVFDNSALRVRRTAPPALVGQVEWRDAVVDVTRVEALPAWVERALQEAGLIGKALAADAAGISASAAGAAATTFRIAPLLPRIDPAQVFWSGGGR